jgi:uncharacterized protein (TIGR00730 family)
VQLQAVCVFCGSNPGTDPVYLAAAKDLGTELANRSLDLVYGGGDVGLMGEVADAALAAGGRVVGVMPEALLAKEIGHQGLSELHVVRSMHERKAMMADRADAFITLPGGYGTLEELFEVLTWLQLGLHAKPCAMLDVAGFWDPLLAQLDKAVTEGFLHPRHRDLLLQEGDAGRLLDRLATYEPVHFDKWLDPDET